MQLSDVALGLQYLHSRSVVHGDLSGVRGLVCIDLGHTYTTNMQLNVLIHGNGRAFIADFGLSTLLTELGGSTFATSFQARGTLRWAAPELLDLQSEEDSLQVVPTPQSDVYSFGGVMLQVLTGKVPYHYYSHDEWVLVAISKGETPKRPNQALVTDRRWTFTQRRWTPVDAGRSLLSGDAIVEFTRNELVQLVLPQS
ncbi:kinase-like protein [Gyrodon lividus]|nr:kinase-like protein [Gyrodon lividus]